MAVNLMQAMGVFVIPPEVFEATQDKYGFADPLAHPRLPFALFL